MNPDDHRPSHFDPRRPPQWSGFKTAGSERPRDTRGQRVVSFLSLLVVLGAVGALAGEFVHFRVIGGTTRRSVTGRRHEYSTKKPNHPPFLIGGAAVGAVVGMGLWFRPGRKEDE